MNRQGCLFYFPATALICCANVRPLASCFMAHRKTAVPLLRYCHSRPTSRFSCSPGSMCAPSRFNHCNVGITWTPYRYSFA